MALIDSFVDEIFKQTTHETSSTFNLSLLAFVKNEKPF
jgi:hypothetical protein